MYRLLVIVISLSVSFNAYTGEQKVKALYNAIKSGDISGFNLKADPDIVHSRDDFFQNTPLHIATLFGHNEIIVQLLNAGADVNARNRIGETPLGYIGNRNLEGLNILIKAGADVNAQEMDGTTALMMATYKGVGSEDLVISLLNAGADVDIKDQEGRTALDWALHSPQYSISTTNRLVEAGADVSIIKPESFTIAFRWLARMREQDKAIFTMTYLIQMGADADALNVQDFMRGETPLHYAIRSGHEKTVAQMLKYGADPNIKNKKGNTAYCMAKKQGHVSIMKLLEDSKKFSCSK